MIITIMMSNHNFEPDQYDLNHHDNDVELQLSNYFTEDFYSYQNKQQYERLVHLQVTI